ncbi:type VII secretion protein EccE [Nocardia sp. NPDC003693]
MRRVRIRIGLPERGPLAVLVIGGAPLLAGLTVWTRWWAVLLIGCAALAVLTIRVRERTATRWLRDWGAYRFGRTARAGGRADLPPARDVEVAAGACGIRSGESTLVAMIQLAPNLDLPTVIAEDTVYTEDIVTTQMLTPLLDQYGVGVDIDIVSTGRRARAEGDYGPVYEQVIGAHPVVGDRLTWLVVRLDQRRNLTALARRGPCAISGPRALAGAAHRIAGRLRERGIDARVLPAAAMEEATLTLCAGMELSDLRENWGDLATAAPGRRVSSFVVDWSRLGDTGLADCWARNRGRTTVVIALSDAAAGPRALVRFVGPDISDALPPGLRPLSGRQSTALLATLPTAVSVWALPHTDAEHLSDAPATVDVPLGPNGQVVGSLTGRPRHVLALPLFDQIRYHPRRRTIDVRASLPIAQQIVLRTMVMGASVIVHTSRPHQWRPLVAAVGDPLALRLAADAPDSDAAGSPGAVTVEVLDQLSPREPAAQAGIVVGDPGTRGRRSADLTIDQVDATTLEVGIPMRTVRVDLIEPHGETRFFEPAADSESADELVPAV